MCQKALWVVTVGVMLKEELNNIQLVIAATVADAVRRTLSTGTVGSKEDAEIVVKTYAEATKQSQNKVIEERTQAQASDCSECGREGGQET